MLLKLLLGSGAYLLYSMRHQLGDIEDLRDKAKETYETASRRISRASDALRGQDERALSTAAALLMGVGVGVGAGMLVAPSSAQKIRTDISERAKETYEAACRRLGRASDALRGKDHSLIRIATTSLMGVGVGVGIGMLVAPSSAQEIRADISEEARDFGEKVRARSSKQPRGTTGTYAET